MTVTVNDDLGGRPRLVQVTTLAGLTLPSLRDAGVIMMVVTVTVTVIWTCRNKSCATKCPNLKERILAYCCNFSKSS